MSKLEDIFEQMEKDYQSSSGSMAFHKASLRAIRAINVWHNREIDKVLLALCADAVPSDTTPAGEPMYVPIDSIMDCIGGKGE